MTREQVFEIVEILNESQYKASVEAEEFAKQLDQNCENVIEEV